MKQASVASLFALLIPPPVRTDADIASLLGVELSLLRARLVELRERGVLTGPFETEAGEIWKSWFSTAADTEAAAGRSGLRSDAPVVLPMPWWRRGFARS